MNVASRAQLTSSPTGPPEMQAGSRKSLVVIGFSLCLVMLGSLSFLAQFPPCDGYPAWQTSPYVLPYPVGEGYVIHQANCSLGGYHGIYRYSVDFLMPIGTPVTAAREGEVIDTLEGVNADFRLQ